MGAKIIVMVQAVEYARVLCNEGKVENFKLATIDSRAQPKFLDDKKIIYFVEP
jgi:hypothetical protein